MPHEMASASDDLPAGIVLAPWAVPPAPESLTPAEAAYMAALKDPSVSYRRLAKVVEALLTEVEDKAARIADATPFDPRCKAEIAGLGACARIQDHSGGHERDGVPSV